MMPSGHIVSAIAAALLLVLAKDVVVRAQSSDLPIISSQTHHARGQGVVPLYRGWFTGSDGRTYAAYEYLNRNSDEVLQIPIGPENAVAPGPMDQGQPTYFLPGHHEGVFAVPIPEGSVTELTWTLTVRGQTFSMPSNLDPIYEIDGLVNHSGTFPGNTPPLLRFAEDGPSAQGPAGLTTTAETPVGTPLRLEVWVADDGLPPPPDRSKVIRSLQESYRRAAGSEKGVTVTWTKYRGPADVHFPDATPPIEQGRASTTATFAEPGEYMLWALVSDGSGFDGCCWTNGYVLVHVRGNGE